MRLDAAHIQWIDPFKCSLYVWHQNSNRKETELPQVSKIVKHIYEKHMLVGLNQIYYWVLKCTTCYHYANIIKSGLINLIKIGNIFTTEKGIA